MSQPDRFDAADLRCDACQSNTDIYGIMKTHNKGRWVKWDDYAALAAENERLKESQLSLEKWIACEQAHFETANNLREKLYQASVQIERLRQAGDVLMQCYCAGDLVKEEWKQLPSVAQWLAAKEGRDAK